MEGVAISVLYVEDDPGVFEATTLLLETCGYRVRSARSLGEALTTLEGESFEPDVILADSDLGAGELGITVVLSVRRRFARTVPAIIMTGDDWGPTAGVARAEACRVLRKPVDAPRLIALIERLASELPPARP